MFAAGVLAAGLVGVGIAYVAPEPSSVPGMLAVGIVAALAVVVGRLAVALRDRNHRLRRIEQLLGERLDQPN